MGESCERQQLVGSYSAIMHAGPHSQPLSCVTKTEVRLIDPIRYMIMFTITKDPVSPRNSAFPQITGLRPWKLQAPSATRLARQLAVQGVIPIFIVGLSMYALF